MQELISAQLKKPFTVHAWASTSPTQARGQLPPPGHPSPWGTALGTGQLMRALHAPVRSSTGRFLTDLFWFSVRCSLNSCAYLFPPLPRVWQNEQMLECKGVAGRDGLAQGLCSPAAAEPQPITLTWLYLVFTAFVYIDLNHT